MQEYLYQDFLNALDETGRCVAEAIHQHIAKNHPDYQPYGVLPKDKTKKEWSLHFRKSPKHGKPLCSLFSANGALSVRFIFYSPMANEVLLRQNEFREKIRTEILRACACRGCGCFGDKEFCWCQHHYYVNDQLLYSCNCAWFTVDNIKDGDLSEDDIRDLLYLTELQSKHMSHNAKESRGTGYDEENLLRCGSASIVKLNRVELDIDVFDPIDFADLKRLDKYAETYHFTPMGANDGLWYYFDDKAVCGTPSEGYTFTTVPEGNYAMITVSNPFTFSAVRAWDYICLWLRKNNIQVTSVDIGGLQTHTLVKFFKQGANQSMEMYVPVHDDKMKGVSMSECEIVELTPDDLVKCSSFWGYPNPRLEEFLRSGSRKVFAYKIGDEFVGGCALIIGENQHGHFSVFFVREDLRGKGIGSRILEFAINLFKEKNIKTIRLHVLKDNQTAIKLYTRYGFTYLEDITPEKIAMIKNIL